MSPTFAVIFAVVSLVTSDKVPSVDFSGSADSEMEFGKSANARKDSVVYGFDSAQRDNEVAADSTGYLINFKSLHNATDLQALASDVRSESVRGQQQNEQSASDRVDNPRVLRGTAETGLDHPFFSPFKHNKIDTADFSDCALQGEWQPIGGPIDHHYAHHEDSQKEHFHAAAEDHDAFPSAALQSHHSHKQPHTPLEAEGVAFWNQFLQQSNNKGNIFDSGKKPYFQKQHYPEPHHGHHKHALKPPKKILHHSPPPPNPPPPQQPSFNDFDVFQNIRAPSADVNVFSIQQKPAYGESPREPQTIIATKKPVFNDIDFSLIPKNPKDSFPLSSSGHLKDAEDYLSPPPMPLKHHNHKIPAASPLHAEKPRPQYLQRPKHIPKPHKVPHKIRVPTPFRPPPPVFEYPDDHSQGGYPQHHHEHHEQPNPSESSTFTCGHNHDQGTNYHTASYQVEGEADPTLLEEDNGIANHFAAPVILGHPSFDHKDHHEEDDSDIYKQQNEQRFPKQNYPPLDLDHEGTEFTGPDEGEDSKDVGPQHNQPYAEKQVLQTAAPESVTKGSLLDTTAPQTFQTDPIPDDIFQKDSIHEPDTQVPFGIKFDHSAFSHVDINSFGSPSGSFIQGENSGSFGTKGATKDVVSDFYQSTKTQPSSQSQSGGFFGSLFTSPFLEGTGNSEGPPPPPPQPKPEKSPFSQSFSEFSFNDFNSKPKGKYHKASIAVFDHPPPHNKTKTHLPPTRKRPPHKTYEVNENSGEMIPVSAFFPPKKGPRQFNNRTPNLAGPKAKRPKSPPPPPPSPKYQSSIHFDGSNLDVYQSNPRKLTKIKLKPKRTRGSPRFVDSDYRRSLTITSRI